MHLNIEYDTETHTHTRVHALTREKEYSSCLKKYKFYTMYVYCQLVRYIDNSSSH